MLFQRPLITISTLLLAFAAGSAAAQQPVVMQLTYTPSGSSTEKTCIFTTNGGVSMNSDSSLAARGSFGTDCPTSQVVQPGTPSFSNSLTGDTPASANTNATLTLTWQADADRCTYDGSSAPMTLATWPTTGDACSTAGTCNTPHTVNITASTNGQYKFKLNCYKTGNNTPVSSETTTNVSTVTTGCQGPAGTTRQTVAQVCDAGGGTCRGSVDVTKFENVYGYSATQGIVAWPGRRNLQQRVVISNNNFVAMQFTVPSTYPTDKYGYLSTVDTNFFGTMSLKISKNCGDLAPTSNISSHCILNNAGGGTGAMRWTTYTSGATFNESCPLVAGETYYLHILHADLNSPGTSTCPLGECRNPIQNGPGNF
jgi:hypothetical protein